MLNKVESILMEPRMKKRGREKWKLAKLKSMDSFSLSGDRTNNYNLDRKKIANQHERKIYVT